MARFERNLFASKRWLPFTINAYEEFWIDVIKWMETRHKLQWNGSKQTEMDDRTAE